MIEVKYAIGSLKRAQEAGLSKELRRHSLLRSAAKNGFIRASELNLACRSIGRSARTVRRWLDGLCENGWATRRWTGWTVASFDRILASLGYDMSERRIDNHPVKGRIFATTLYVNQGADPLPMMVHREMLAGQADHWHKCRAQRARAVQMDGGAAGSLVDQYLSLSAGSSPVRATSGLTGLPVSSAARAIRELAIDGYAARKDLTLYYICIEGELSAAKKLCADDRRFRLIGEKLVVKLPWRAV